MPRVTHVKHARQRYETVPVIDPETGEQKTTPMISKRTGEQKTTKRGKPVVLGLTRQDRTKPLPNIKCDFPGCTVDGGEILPGTPYKHITPRSGPYGGRQRSRHAEHPSWKVWEYSSSTSARVAQIQDAMDSSIDAFEFSDPSDFEGLKDELSQMAQELLDEKEDALSNMPEGLAYGSQVEEQRDTLQEWVDSIESVGQPEDPETEEDCPECNGVGRVPDVDSIEEEAEIDCDECSGTGLVEIDGIPDEWIEEAKEALRDAIGECNV